MLEAPHLMKSHNLRGSMGFRLGVVGMRRILAVFGAIFVAACGSHAAAAPTPQLIVTLTGPATVQGRDTTVSGQAVYYCDFQLTATATGGSAGQGATWGGAHYTYTLASTGATSGNAIAQASAFFSGNPGVSTGTDVSQVHFAGWSSPFELSLVLYYSTPRSSSDSAMYNFSCL
jgi:hypothetical protein